MACRWCEIEQVLRDGQMVCARCKKPLNREAQDTVQKATRRASDIMRRTGGVLRTSDRTGGPGKNWVDGKVISALPAGHPERFVSSERQAMDVCRRHGISMDTGTFVNEKARERAWDPRRTRRDYRKNKVLRASPGDDFGKPRRKAAEAKTPGDLKKRKRPGRKRRRRP